MMNAATLLILSFNVTYYLIERNGFFSGATIPVSNVIYSIPFLSASLLFLIFTLLTTFRNIKNVKMSEWGYVTTVILLISGLWLSYLTHFRGEAVLTEGQIFYSGHGDYLPGTIDQGRFANMPDIGLKLEELVPTLSKDQKHLKGLKGKFSLLSTESDKQREAVITNGLPAFLDSTFYRIKDMGYSPRYVLESKEGKFLDSSFIFMKLFPPGSEDNFRLLSPLTYYVRYYPNGNDEKNEPLIGLRIVRNKDIVYNGTVTMTEYADFENSRISFEEVRRWTILTIYHDPGALLSIPVLILAFVYTIVKIITGKKSSYEQT